MEDAKDCDRNFGLLIKAVTDDFYDTFMIVNSLEGTLAVQMSSRMYSAKINLYCTSVTRQLGNW